MCERRVAVLAMLLALLVACSEAEPPGVRPSGVEFGEPTALSVAPADAFRYFGHAVALGAEWAWIGARGDQEAGAVYPFAREGGGTWSPVAPLRPVSDAGSRFGGALAADGATLAAGAAFDPAAGDRAGRVYVYEGAMAQPVARLEGDAPLGYFGTSVDVRGTTMVVGAPGPGATSVYVFERDGGEWARAQQLSGVGDSRVRFGASVALAEEALAIGAWSEGSASEARAFVYRRTEGAWQQAAEITPAAAMDAPGADPDFGTLVALAGDRLAVSGRRAVHVYARGADGWDLVSSLAAPLDEPRFGDALVFASNTLFVGAPRQGDPQGAGGRVYAYQRGPTGWQEQGRLARPEAGFAEALDADAENLLVGIGGSGRSHTALLVPWQATP